MMVKFVRSTLTLLALALVAGAALADPSGRVGRISYLQGQVDFRSVYDDDAAAALLNWPLTSHNVITTERGARAELRVGSTAIRLDADSELEIAQLDDDHVRLRLLYGSANVRIQNRELADDFELRTPQGRLLLSGPARFRVDTERAPDSTGVSVFSGAIRFDNDGNSLTVPAGRHLDFTEGNMRVGGLQRDAFDDWALARDQRDEQAPSLRYLSPETTGYEELDNYGNWQVSRDYGPVWIPNAVPAGWSPYQSGRWTWVEPWGWTWVDNAPWGYAPTHYGRWALIKNRWCWAPGALTARPVWAPALVGWVGGSNWRVSFSGGAAPAVGWFPLAPREVFVPSYSVSPTYVRQVNITHVTSINNITNVNGFAQLPPQAHYQNRDLRNAVTVVPHAEFEHGRRSVPVTSLPRMIDPRQLQQAPTSATAALPRDQHFQRDPMNVPRERRYLQQSQPQPQQQQQQPLQQQAQPVQPQAIQRQPVPLQQVAPQSLPTAPTPPRDWRIQQRQEASQGNLDAAQPQRRMIPSTPAPAAVAPPVQTPPRPEAANPAPVGRERAAERAQQATPDENRGHRAERPSAPPPPQVQTRVEPVRVAPAAVAPPAAVAVPAAAPVATPRPARVENRAPTEARPRQRDGKDDERGRRQERGDPHD